MPVTLPRLSQFYGVTYPTFFLLYSQNTSHITMRICDSRQPFYSWEDFDTSVKTVNLSSAWSAPRSTPRCSAFPARASSENPLYSSMASPVAALSNRAALIIDQVRCAWKIASERYYPKFRWLLQYHRLGTSFISSGVNNHHSRSILHYLYHL